MLSRCLEASQDGSYTQIYWHVSGLKLPTFSPSSSKVLEHVIYRIIFQHLRNHWPISSNQWGFLSCRSSISVALSVTHDWPQHLDEGHDMCAVYFDLCKAFDSVPHRPLLQKLIDIQLKFNGWTAIWPIATSQLLVVEDTCFPVLPVLSGVPQGSVLSALLFSKLY